MKSGGTASEQRERKSEQRQHAASAA